MDRENQAQHGNGTYRIANLRPKDLTDMATKRKVVDVPVRVYMLQGHLVVCVETDAVRAPGLPGCDCRSLLEVKNERSRRLGRRRRGGIDFAG